MNDSNIIVKVIFFSLQLFIIRESFTQAKKNYYTDNFSFKYLFNTIKYVGFELDIITKGEIILSRSIICVSTYQFFFILFKS